MIKIDKENINSYYKLVKKKLDDYMTFNINPSKLKKYLSYDKNINKFISKSELGDIDGIKKIINDILDDLCVQKIMTFESYINISIKPNIDDLLMYNDANLFGYEKVLADYSRVSLSKIMILDNTRRLFTIGDNKYHILSVDDVESLKKKLCDVISNQIQDVKYRFGDIGIEVRNHNKVDIQFNMNNNIDRVIKNIYDIYTGSDVSIDINGGYKIVKIK